MAGTPSKDIPIEQFWDIPEQVDAAWSDRRRLAAALRVLCERCITSDGDLDRAADFVEAAIESLPAGPTSREAYDSGRYFEEPAAYPDRGAMFGRCNPIAPPMQPTWEAPTATCRITLDERYVGAPGMVHGGLVAAVFDQLCGHAAVMSGHGVVTTRLTLRYHRPVPLHAECRFEATVGDRKRRRIAITGRAWRADTLLADCEGVFHILDPRTARAVFEGA